MDISHFWAPNNCSPTVTPVGILFLNSCLMTRDEKDTEHNESEVLYCDFCHRKSNKAEIRYNTPLHKFYNHFFFRWQNLLHILCLNYKEIYKPFNFINHIHQFHAHVILVRFCQILTVPWQQFGTTMLAQKWETYTYNKDAL